MVKSKFEKYQSLKWLYAREKVSFFKTDMGLAVMARSDAFWRKVVVEQIEPSEFIINKDKVKQTALVRAVFSSSIIFLI